MEFCGTGFWLFQSPNNRAMLTSAPRERTGAAGRMLSTGRLLGRTTCAAGVAILFRTFRRRSPEMALDIAAALVSLSRLKSAGHLENLKHI